MNRSDFKIEIKADPEARTLTITDNGIGMSKEDLENNLGVIASSGSYRFRQEMAEKDEKNEDVDIIGQFGVGFYSAFMVADTITVTTKKYGEEQAGSGNPPVWTDIPLPKLSATAWVPTLSCTSKEDAEGEDYSVFFEGVQAHGTDPQILRLYSLPHSDGSDQASAQGRFPEDKPEYEDVKEVETINSMVPLWQRRKGEVTDEEYNKFYQEKFFDYVAPQRTIPISVEGTVTYKALLFIPGKTPYDFYTKDYKKGLQPLFRRCAYYGELRRPAAGLPAICQGCGGYAGRVAEHFPRDAPA